LAAEVEENEPDRIHLLIDNAGIAWDENTKYSNGSPDQTEVGLTIVFIDI